MRPRGHVVTTAWCKRTGRRLWTREADNLVVYAGTINVANHIADLTNFGVVAFGVGSGGGAPSTGDTALTNPSYYKEFVAATTVSGSPLPATITFNWGINSGSPLDHGAKGIVATEIGLFMNPTGVALPDVISTVTLGTWASGSPYVSTPASSASVLLDSNLNVQVCTTAGTSGGSEPTWATTIGNTTADNTVTWTCRALHSQPTVLFARALMPLGVLTPAVGFTSTWFVTV